MNLIMLMWRYFCTRRRRFTERAKLERWQEKKTASLQAERVIEKPMVSAISRGVVRTVAADGQGADDDAFR